MTGGSPASDRLIGHALGHFRLESKLGEGGMGVVYRATDERLRRVVALKVLPDTLASDPERRRRFLREARAAAAVSHPNIAAVYDIGEAEGHVFIAMELLTGETLRAKMDPGLTHAEALRIGREVAKGLAQAHESGVVHRDLKPENVIITRDGGVKILDFGLAKMVEVEPGVSGAAATASQGTAEGRVMGTPPYMSPEQAEGLLEIDARSDVFSFGTMLYEMMAGVRPFTGNTSFAVLYGVLHKEPEPLSTLCPDAPTAAVAVVARCLKKARGERFASGRALSAALEENTGAARAMDTPSGKALPAARVSTVSGMGTALGATLAADVPRVEMLGGTRSDAMAASKRGAWPWAFGGLVAIVAAGTLGWSRHHTPASLTATASAAPSASGAAPPRLRCNAEATRLFDEAVETFDSRSETLSMDAFSRAIAADRGCAPAYLRVTLTYVGGGDQPPSSVRTLFAEARAHSDRLSDAERELLDAIAPDFAAQSDPAAVLVNLRALASRRPDDALMAYYHGRVASARHSVEEARGALERTVALRPGQGGAYASLAVLAASPDERERLLGQCRRVAPRHTYCDSVEQNALMRGSDCRAFDRFAREAMARNPGWSSQMILVRALAANDASPGALDEALRQLVSTTPAGEPSKEIDGEYRFPVAVLEGDYSTAERILRGLPDATSADLEERADWAVALAVLLDDTGRSGEADDLVREVLRSAPALIAPTDPTRMAPFDARAIAAGALRRVDVDAAFGPAPALTDETARWKSWAYRQLFLVRTTDEAKRALAVMPPGRPAADESDYELGSARVLAGDFVGAQRDLESALNRCDTINWAAYRPRAFLLLAEAQERTGDFTAARGTYETVVKRWGALKPKAVLADRARVRLAALAKR